MNDFADGCAWIDGEYVPIADARVPVLDTGFTRSDLTYDVIGVWDGAFFRLEDHLDRFERGLRKLRLRSPVARAELVDILLGVVARSGLREAYVEVVVTRGVPAGGSRDPRRAQPRLIAYAIPYLWIVAPEDQERGVDVVVAREVERISPRAVDPTVKNFHWGDFIRGQFEAYDRGATLAILTDGAGRVAEGPGFNVFALHGRRLRTPAAGVLEGITRRTVLELAEEEGLEVQVGDLPAADLPTADELFFTSTAGGVMPAATLDGAPVGATQPGPVTLRLRERYWELHRHQRYATAVDYGEVKV